MASKNSKQFTQEEIERIKERIERKIRKGYHKNHWNEMYFIYYWRKECKDNLQRRKEVKDGKEVPIFDYMERIAFICCRLDIGFQDFIFDYFDGPLSLELKSLYYDVIKIDKIGIEHFSISKDYLYKIVEEKYGKLLKIIKDFGIESLSKLARVIWVVCSRHVPKIREYRSISFTTDIAQFNKTISEAAGLDEKEMKASIALLRCHIRSVDNYVITYNKIRDSLDFDWQEYYWYENFGKEHGLL